MSFYPTINYPWAAAVAYDKDDGQTGVIAPSNQRLGNTSAAVTASRAYAVRFRPSRTMAITAIGFVVGTAAGADDACDVGIYDASFNRIVSAGATSGKLNSGGTKTITIATTTLLPAVTYYAAFSVGTLGGTAASLVMTSCVGTSGNIGDMFGTSNGVREQTFQASGHPLPTTLTPGGLIGSCPYLALRES